jgi:hypothetical protein
LEEVVERGSSIQDPKDFSSLLLGVPGEGEVEEMVERCIVDSQKSQR